MLPTEADNIVHVAVAIILNPAGQVLLSKRRAGTHQGNMWEYPGGKICPGETVFDALKREISEELGLVVNDAVPVMRVPYNYPENRKVLLDIWRVNSSSGDPIGLEGQPVQWRSINDLEKIQFPAANNKITRMLQLPAVYGITPSMNSISDEFVKDLNLAMENGLRMLQIRQPHMSHADLVRFARKIIDICQDRDIRLLINSDIKLARQLGIDGVHLNSTRLNALTEKPAGGNLVISASCHNESELKKAEAIGADFVVLSPVKTTSSHPGVEPLGWEKFKELATNCDLPVYALGGLNQDDIYDAKRSGAIGISLLSDLWH